MKKLMALLLLLSLLFGCTAQTSQNTNAQAVNDSNDSTAAGTQTEIDGEANSPGDANDSDGAANGSEDAMQEEGEPGPEPSEVPDDNELVDPPQEELPPAQEPPSEEPQMQEFFITSNDYGFYDTDGTEVTEIIVQKGAQVKINFYVPKEKTYYGGMTIRGNGLDSGKINKEETWVAEFVAEESFDFKSFWPLTNQFKAKLKVTVE